MRSGRFVTRTPAVLTYSLIIIALSLGILWLIPANYYMIFPGQAQQVSTMISVKGHRPAGGGGLYDTYVNEFKASRLLYVLFGLVRSDVTIEPAAEVSSGCPDPQYEQQLLAMMTDSKIQAEAAALHVLHYKVEPQKGGPEIDQVSCNVPAAQKLRAGDRIIGIDGHPVHTFNQVKHYTSLQKPGSIIHLRIRRLGAVKVVSVRTVHANAAGVVVPSGGHTMIGIIMTEPLRFPVKVHINSGDVGGPSAGLAFALGIVQQLTHHSLTHGNKVAVTGTISLVTVPGPGGRATERAVVGAIGGARQKALAAQAAGAKYFLVPYTNYSDAVSAHADLKVIPVHTLGDALRVLRSLPRSGSRARAG